MYTTIAKYRSASFEKKIYASIFSLILYALLVSLIYPKVGEIALALSVIPVLCIAWLFGIKAGIAGWALVSLGNTSFELLEGSSLLNTFLYDLPGIIAVLPFALIAGYVSDLSLKYRSQLEELAKKNDELKQEISMRKNLEMLFSEVNHRIKNNLAMITSILEMETMKSTNSETTEILNNVKNRIYSVAAAHEQLYKNDVDGEIPFKIFLENLLDHIRASCELTQKFYINSEIDPIKLDTRLAIHLALIVNELVTNALKYAFPDQQVGEINVKVARGQEDNTIELTVHDNGNGLPEGFDPYNTDISKSIGMQMVTNLVEQWEGTLDADNNEGARFHISLNPNSYEKSTMSSS